MPPRIPRRSKLGQQALERGMTLEQYRRYLRLVAILRALESLPETMKQIIIDDLIRRGVL
jgi:hypothetical protein